MSKQLKWHSGPPPSIGWWPASVCEDEKVLRWWDGEQWSSALSEGDTPYTVRTFASTPANLFHFGRIEWTHRPASWPKRSRT